MKCKIFEETTPFDMGRLGNANCNLSINMQPRFAKGKVTKFKSFFEIKLNQIYLYFIDIAK